jgi:hypothetical protein
MLPLSCHSTEKINSVRANDRERYAHMDSNKKDALLQSRREAYQQTKSSTGNSGTSPIRIVQ